MSYVTDVAVYNVQTLDREPTLEVGLEISDGEQGARPQQRGKQFGESTSYQMTKAFTSATTNEAEVGCPIARLEVLKSVKGTSLKDKEIQT